MGNGAVMGGGETAVVTGEGEAAAAATLAMAWRSAWATLLRADQRFCTPTGRCERHGVGEAVVAVLGACMREGLVEPGFVTKEQVPMLCVCSSMPFMSVVFCCLLFVVLLFFLFRRAYGCIVRARGVTFWVLSTKPLGADKLELGRRWHLKELYTSQVLLSGNRRFEPFVELLSCPPDQASSLVMQVVQMSQYPQTPPAWGMHLGNLVHRCVGSDQIR